MSANLFAAAALAFSTPVLGLGHVQAFGLSATLALRISLFQESKKGRLANKSFYNGSEMAMQALPIHSPCELVFFPINGRFGCMQKRLRSAELF